MAYTAAVITVSDKGYRGERVDTSGPNLVELLKERNFNCHETENALFIFAGIGSCYRCRRPEYAEKS